MLTHIFVQDFAIVEGLELELAEGMTVLTGETGAGKSILVDALGFVLGDRADTGVIRHNQPRAEVSATFVVGELPSIRDWLQEQGLDPGSECLLRRVITREGRSRGYVNGRPVPITALRELGQWLVDIHGQHEHQSLLRRDAQRQLLDDFAGHGPLVAELATVYRRWKDTQEELDSLEQANTDRAARADMLRYQLQELDSLDLGTDEVPSLEQEHSRLANAGRLLEGCQRVLSELYEDDNAVATVVAHAQRELTDLQHQDERLAAPTQLLDEAGIQLREAADELRRYLNDVELDPQRLTWVEERLGTIHHLARKHQVAPQELPATHRQLQAELDQIEGTSHQREDLQAQLAELAERYRGLAQQLTAGRRQAGARLAEAVTANMQELGMPGGRFEVALEPRDDTFSPWGLEQVAFQVSANPGQPLKPLTKVASGGELSRISLAIQVISAAGTGVPTLVFDEVDVGIGGGVAEIVGQLLRRLGEGRQVLSVTHLPQVAAQGHQHLEVRKHTDGEATGTAVQPLDESRRCEEIARMLGGVEITEQTRQHAREMVERAQGR